MSIYKTIGISLACFVVALVAGSGAFIYLAFHPFAPTVRTEGIRVVAIGDSITYGAGVIFDRGRSSYPAKLQALLGSDYQLLNYGLSGRTLLKSGDRPYTSDHFFKLSQDARPEIVLIMLGTNDTKPQNWNAADYETELNAFVSLYKGLPSRPVVYLVTPPAAFTNSFGISGDVIQNEVVPIVRRVAEQTGSPLIDVFSNTKTRPELFSDGVHPGKIGNEMIADTIYADLRKQPRP